MPPQRPVYCDIVASTETSTTVTTAELESILRNRDLNFYVSKVEAEWTAYVKRDYLVPQVTLEECYYTIKLNRVY